MSLTVKYKDPKQGKTVLTKAEKVIPALPEDIRVIDKPVGLEFLQRGNERWLTVIQALDALESTKCLEIAINGLSKSQVVNIKIAIKRAGVASGYHNQIRFAIKTGILLIWANT